MLAEDVEAQLRDIVETANRGTDPVSRQVAGMYASYMDEAGIEARGAAALRPYLDRIAAARTRDDLIRLFAAPGYPSPIGLGIIPDPANPTRYIAFAGQGGLGMPNREYYLREGADYDRYRAAYRDLCHDDAAARRLHRAGAAGGLRSSRSSAGSPRCTGRRSAAATSARSTIR